MRRKASAVGVVLLLLYVVLLIGALSDSGGPVLVGALGSFVGDAVLRRTRYRPLLGLLGRTGLAMSWRFFYRQVLVVAYLLPEPKVSKAAAAVVVVAVVAHHLAFAVFSALRGSIARRRLRRMETRNLRIPAEELPPPLPRRLTGRGT